MRLTIDDKEAQDVLAVTLNGKRVAMPVAFDTDEGWVDALVPQIENVAIVKEGDTIDINNNPNYDAPLYDYITKRFNGDVKVIWNKDKGPK